MHYSQAQIRRSKANGIYTYIDREAKYRHTVMVSEITGILTEFLGWEPKEVISAKHAALLHDVGKNFIPKEILDKPGKLTSEEYAIVRTHADLGHEYLTYQSDYGEPLGWEPGTLSLAAIVALQHHERIDGSGYTGMKGDEINPLAKLVALADVFDALYSYRPYKLPWSIAEIIESFLEGREKIYDAEYVDALLECLDDILSIYKDDYEPDDD